MALETRGIVFKLRAGAKRPDRLCGPPRLIFGVHRGAISLGVKRPERDANDSVQFSAEVKNEWSLTTVL